MDTIIKYITPDVVSIVLTIIVTLLGHAKIINTAQEQAAKKKLKDGKLPTEITNDLKVTLEKVEILYDEMYRKKTIAGKIISFLKWLFSGWIVIK